MEPKADNFTAWNLAGDWWWVGQYYAVIDGGYAQYETATATANGMVCLRRTDELHQINRYVPHDTPMYLVLI